MRTFGNERLASTCRRNRTAARAHDNNIDTTQHTAQVRQQAERATVQVVMCKPRATYTQQSLEAFDSPWKH